LCRYCGADSVSNPRPGNVFGKVRWASEGKAQKAGSNEVEEEEIGASEMEKEDVD
jgi:hypothetical protein